MREGRVDLHRVSAWRRRSWSTSPANAEASPGSATRRSRQDQTLPARARHSFARRLRPSSAPGRRRSRPRSRTSPVQARMNPRCSAPGGRSRRHPVRWRIPWLREAGSANILSVADKASAEAGSSPCPWSGGAFTITSVIPTSHAAQSLFMPSKREQESDQDNAPGRHFESQCSTGTCRPGPDGGVTTEGSVSDSNPLDGRARSGAPCGWRSSPCIARPSSDRSGLYRGRPCPLQHRASTYAHARTPD